MLSIANVFSKHPLFTTFSLFLKVSKVCNISSKCCLSNKTTYKIFLHKITYTLPLFQKNICCLHRRILYKHLLFMTFLLVFTVDKVCYITNKYQLLNNLGKYQYFYTRNFISLLHFKKIFAPSIESIFRNIHFLYNIFAIFNNK